MEVFIMANIDVTIVDSIGSTKRSAGLPNDIAVGRLTAALVRKIGLQMTGANGRPISYFLNLVRSGTSTQLNEDQTLEEQGVVVGDTLRINAQMQAGY